MKALDLFAGAGGWDLAASALGWDVDRVECWAPANATALAAGMPTIHDDVRIFVPKREYDVLIASPPCPTFSVAGLRSGRNDLEALITGVHLGLVPEVSDPRSALSLEPLRIALERTPRFIVWENVPAVLPLWEACARRLRRYGYSVVTGIAHSEQYGVPQTRDRAILMARGWHRDGDPQLPRPTHSRYYPKDQARFDDGVSPWVSAGRVLGLSSGHIGFPRRADRPTGRITVAGRDYRARDLRSVDLPAFGVTEKARSWSCFAADGRTWPVTLDQTMALQTFPAGHPFQGSRSVQFLQCANAVPPLLAHHILTALTA